MRTLLMLLLVQLMCWSDTLPEDIYFRNNQQSFNRLWYVALKDGKIWIKPNRMMTGKNGEWRLLGKTGMPEGNRLKRFGVPDSIIEISMDGIHLTALSSDSVFYRAVNMTKKNSNVKHEWEDKWGGVGANGKGLKAEFSTRRGWSTSDCHTFDVKEYTDMHGTTHPIGFGVAHLYRLSLDGRMVHYNDWWLPEDWSRKFATPQRGEIEGVSLSASGSTVFLLAKDGSLWTRHYDFDMAGCNTLLTYSYITSKRNAVRGLPPHPWVKEASVPGEITKNITIFQTGIGNDARTLRVEGLKNGVVGYFEKEILDTAWHFTATNQLLLDTLFKPDSAQRLKPQDFHYEGLLSKKSGGVQRVSISDFRPFASPANIVFEDGTSLPFHTVHTMILEKRECNYFRLGKPADIRATILIPDELQRNPFFKGKKVINFIGTVSKNEMQLQELSNKKWFIAPGKEKGTEYSLTLKVSKTTLPD